MLQKKQCKLQHNIATYSNVYLTIELVTHKQNVHKQSVYSMSQRAGSKKTNDTMTPEMVDDETNDDNDHEVPARKLLSSMAPKLADEVKP